MLHRAKCRKKPTGAFTLTLPMALARDMNLGDVSVLVFCKSPDGSVIRSVANDVIDEQLEAARMGYHAYRGALRALGE